MEYQSHADEAQNRAAKAMDETRAQAAETVSTAARTGTTFVENQKRLAAAEVDGYACALHETARRLHDQSQDTVAEYAERFARGLDNFAYNLRERDLRDGLDRVADFARRRPLLFVGGAIAAGFVMTRFFKSSESPEEESAMKEKLASGMEKAKESTREVIDEAREKVAEGKDKAERMAEGSPRDEKHDEARIRKESRTAAEVEVPVILKPHEPGHPEGPAPTP